MGLKARWAILLLFSASLPASACTPVLSAAFPAVMLAYLVWVVLSIGLRRRHDFCDRDLWLFGPSVPLGCVWFSVPILVFVLPFAFLFLAFPMHLAVEFFAALFSRSQASKDRRVRLLYYGIPLAIALFGGIIAKWMLYSERGGWRLLMANLSENGPFFGTVSFVVGLAVLTASILSERRRARREASAAPAEPGGAE